MITRIHLENFKGIKERQTIELKPITLLFGPNSSGKSTIIQALHYAREILERQNFNADKTMHGGDVVDLGGFENLVYKHNKSLPIIMQFDLDMTRLDIPDIFDNDDYVALNVKIDVDHFNEYEHRGKEIVENVSYKTKSIWVKLKIEWNDQIRYPIVTEYNVGINDESIVSVGLDKLLSSGVGEYSIKSLNAFHSLFEIVEKYQDTELKITNFFLWVCDITGIDFNNKDSKINFPLLQKTAIPEKNKPISFSPASYRSNLGWEDQISIYWFEKMITMLLTGPCNLLSEQLNKFRYIGPIRTIPKRNYIPNETHNESRWSDGQAAWDLLYKEGEKYIDETNDWMFNDEKFDTGYKLELRESKNWPLNDPIFIKLLQGTFFDDDINFKAYASQIPTIRRLCLVDPAKDIELAPKDVGVGISQVLPVIVGAIAQNGSIMAVEQPELHLHPRQQLAIADLLISQINKKDDTIYLIETHSEHLMLRLLRRIEETTNEELPEVESQLQPEELSVNIFTPEADGIKIMNNPIDETGEFKMQWPGGFFEERGEELFSD